MANAEAGVSLGSHAATARATSRLSVWRSPPDQPRWARPALLVVAALAALSYAWGIGSDTLETFYAAAVRSMSQNWHNFFFGAFDPWGTVSIDKLPGAFWVQALSVRIFGVHPWAFVLPQVLEGTLTVLVLYRAVRRVAGPLAGLTAAVVVAASPVTILLNRGNISDSLLLLLLVLAADAGTAALMTGRLSSLIVAGVWVGLAFQAKMLQAWLVLPAIYMAYLLAAPANSLYRRLGHVLLSVLAVIVISLSWVTIVSIVPADARPYADGSCNNSVFSQVFLYNGTDRLSGNTLDQSGCSKAPASVATSAGSGSDQNVGMVALPRGPGRFLSGPFGRDAAWSFLPALVALVSILVLRRSQPRRDPLRAAVVLWGATLFFTWCFFSSSDFLNSYYLAALIPPLAALCGLGAATAWEMRARSLRARLMVMATVSTGAAYSLTLIPKDAGIRTWAITSTVLVAVTAIGLLAHSLRRGAVTSHGLPIGLGLSALALLIGSAWASATVVLDGLGPFDTPYQPAALTALIHSENRQALAAWPALNRFAAPFPHARSIQTGQTSAGVSLDTLATGREFLPVGGFTGQVPNPSLDQFVSDVAHHVVAQVLVAVSPPSTSPDLRWAVVHCRRETRATDRMRINETDYQRYLCSPSDAGLR
jgi:4-amino-4-deoxy-L-arabinose transferase-like glycosyltransferase